MLFFAQRQNKTGTWQTRGFVRFWPIKYQRGPREPEPQPPARATRRTRDRAPLGAPGSPPAAPGAAPGTARSPGAPRPSRTRGWRRGPGRRIPTHPGPLSERALRRGPRCWSRALPKPARRPSPASCGLPRQAPPRGPASGESVPPAQVRSGDGIRCQQGGQTPPVGGGEASLTSFRPPPTARAGRSPSAPLPGSGKGASPQEAGGGAAGAQRGSGVWVTPQLGRVGV